MKPIVTVLLPAYNAARTVLRAVDSILRQSFQDFELLVLDDGSTDGTTRLLEGIRDPRLRLERSERNRGVVATLNAGLDLARGRYIARMDADDWAHPRRLELQCAFLDAHPSVGICGTWYRMVSGRHGTVVRTPRTHDAICAALFFHSAIGHPTATLRRSFLDDAGLRYDAGAADAEDFDLWERARRLTRMANLPKVLLDYHLHALQVSSRRFRSQLASSHRVRLRQLAELVPHATCEERELHLRTCGVYQFKSADELARSRGWLDRLGEANRRVRLFPEWEFRLALADAWTNCCLRATAVPPRQLIPLYLSRRYAGLAVAVIREQLRVVSSALRRAAR